jgi:hypothetical protein
LNTSLIWASSNLLWIFMKLSYFTFLAVATAALTACGGGGSDAPAPAQVPPVASAASVYAGTWARQCNEDADVKIVTSAAGVIPATTKPAYRITSLKNVTSSGSSSATGQTELQYFDNTTCSGTAKAKQTLNFSFTIDGKFIVGTKTADKVTVTVTPIGGLSAGTTITINDVVYPGDYFTRGGVEKDLFLVEGTKWFSGKDSAADQYPTELEPVKFFTKQ